MSNIDEVYLNYKFQSSLVYEIIGSVSILIIGLYLDNVLPSAHGLRKPWLFVFRPSFWGCGRCKTQRQSNKTFANGVLSPDSD